MGADRVNADRSDDSWDFDDIYEKGYCPSQVVVFDGDIRLNPDLPLPEHAMNEVEYIISSNTWEKNARKLPRGVRKAVFDLSCRPLLYRDGRTWGDAGEFDKLVDNLLHLCKRTGRRGSSSSSAEEDYEIIEVLQEAAKQNNATPQSVLDALVEEFGIP